MSVIAVRHGQASYGAPDYDQLSDLGFEQSRRLGRWLAANTPAPTRVVVGGMRRHRQTFEALAEGFRAAGVFLPEAETDADLNEFDHRAVLAGFARLQPEAALADAPAADPQRPDPRRVLKSLLAALTAWTEERLEDVPERWPEFQARTRAAAARLSPPGAATSGPVLAVSSGGVLSQFAQAALETSHARAIELNLSLRNSAICEFHCATGTLRLGSWNSVPHLADASDMWTYF